MSTLAKVPNGVERYAENYNRLSRVHERYRQADDRRTGNDLYSEHERELSEREITFTFAKNVRLWLKHKLVSVLAIGQLYHQSATAPRCTPRLRDVHGLLLSVISSSKPVSCTFLDIFYSSLFPVLYQNIPESVAEHRSLLIPRSFKSKLCLLHYQFEIFTSYLLKFT